MTTADASAPSPVAIWTTIVVLLVAIEAVDVATGPYVVLATFYLLPVGLAAWYLGRPPAVAVALMAGAGGLVAAHLDPGEMGEALVVWNNAVRLVTYLAFVWVVTAQRDSSRRLETLASTDPLTGLANRRHFFETAAGTLARLGTAGRPIALLYLDVDGLKQRNDELGHDAGDAMLQEVAGALVSMGAVVAARFGGDEFCALLAPCDLDGGEAKARSLIATLANDPTPPIGVSVGVVAGPPTGHTIDDLITRADTLMIEAKRSGKGTVRSSSL